MQIDPWVSSEERERGIGVPREVEMRGPVAPEEMRETEMEEERNGKTTSYSDSSGILDLGTEIPRC